MIDLRGVLDRSFDARWCLRGFAPMGVLAKISQADTDYQRPPDENHIQEILEFYTNDTDNLFFPEVTLCLSLDAVNATVEQSDWMIKGPLAPGCVNYEKYWQHNIGKMFVKFYTLQNEKFRTASFSLPEDEKTLYRIDGNHRLVAAERMMADFDKKKRDGLSYDPKYVQRSVPFCIVIFPNGSPWKLSSTKYFTNINFKALPLSKELNIKGIVDNTKAYSDDDLFNDPALGPSFVFCRYMVGCSREDASIRNFVGEGKYVFFQALGECLCEKEQFENVDQLKVFCANLNERLKLWLKEFHDSANCCYMVSSVVKATAFYYHIQDGKAYKESSCTEHNGGRDVNGPFNKCARFIAWIKTAHIEKLDGLPLKELIRIFDAVYNVLPKKLFLARWYPESGDEKRKSDARYDAIVKMAKDLNFEVVDMEHQHSGAFSIRDAIDQKIPESDLFIADLTGARPNVMVEVGMALHHLPRNRVLFFMQDADVPEMKAPVDKPPFDLSGYSYDRIVDSSEIEKYLGRRIRGILNIPTSDGDDHLDEDSEHLDEILHKTGADVNVDEGASSAADSHDEDAKNE